FTFLFIGFYFFGLEKNNYNKKIIQINDVKFSVEIAASPHKKALGLSKRDFLKENEGMLFLFDKPDNYGFWMKDMKFPIDILFINDTKIVDIKENCMPEPEKSIFNLTIYRPNYPADKVLEIGGGLVKKYKIKIGDEIRFDF
ncbi:MAG: DUF192 domain-containing protein, partial [Patescibacteria group bacterium]|nr:DUF192 domain-containing protein [Patescibacteria group bacterium]MDW8280051.1 DUF192 domain-containing protein [bacterium]